MPAPSAKLSLSVIMPALNEEPNISDAISLTLAGMDDFGIPGEIIVVNDGSTDATGDIVRQWMDRDPRVRMLRHETPQGIGRSFWHGVEASEMQAVVMLPGDNENYPAEIFRYYDLLEHVDIVIPFLFNREARSLFRNALSFCYRFIINASFFVNLNYTNGTVLYRRKLLTEMESRSNGFFFQTQILITAIKRGYLFAEVPYRISTRAGGKSTAVKFPSFVNVVQGYFSLLREVQFRKQHDQHHHHFAESATCARRKEL